MSLTLHFLDDDYAINRFHQLTLSKFTTENDCAIQFFDDSRLLLDLYRDKSVELPDLLFLDINMPVLDGWQFLDQFKEAFPHSGTKIVILTTSNNPTYVDKSANYQNVLNFELKPLKVARMEETLSLLKSRTS